MSLQIPVLIVNFKTYQEGTGLSALNLAEICDNVAKETGKGIAIAVQSTDIKMISRIVQIPVLAQHVDGVTFGANTGSVTPEAVIQAGAMGSLLNHSEDKYRQKDLQITSHSLAGLGMIRIMCADTPAKAKEVARHRPEFIAIEPPELIGGKKSVSKEMPTSVSDTVDLVANESPNTIVLCGAGVHSKEDVKKALELGAQGVLVASAIVKSKDPKAEILELISAF